MKRRLIIGVGALLAVAVGAGVWRYRSGPRVYQTGPDSDGFSWTSTELDQEPKAVRAPPLGDPPAEPPLVRGSWSFIGARTTLSFSPDGKQLRVDLTEFDLQRVQLLDVGRAAPVSDEVHDKGKHVPVPTDWTQAKLPEPPKFAGRTLSLGEGKPRLVFPSAVEAAAWDPKGSLLAIALRDGLFFWSTGRGLVRVAGPPSPVGNGICSPDGTRAVIGALRVVDFTTGKVTPLASDVNGDYLLEHHGVWREQGSALTIAMVDHLLHFDPATGSVRGKPVRPNHERWQVWAVDGNWGFGKLVPYGIEFEVFDARTGEQRFTLSEISSHSEGGSRTAEVAVSEDGRWLVTGMYRNLVVRDFSTHHGVSVSGVDTDTVSLVGSTVLSAGGRHVATWQVGSTRPEAHLVLEGGLGEVARHSLSHAGDRLVLRSGHVVALDPPAVVSAGPAGLGAKKEGFYSNACWGAADRWLTYFGDDVIVLHRLADGANLLLYQFVVGEAVELLVMTPDGHFDGPDALLESVWFRHGDDFRLAKSQSELRRPGLLAAFHAGK